MPAHFVTLPLGSILKDPVWRSRIDPASRDSIADEIAAMRSQFNGMGLIRVGDQHYIAVGWNQFDAMKSCFPDTQPVYCRVVIAEKNNDTEKDA